MKKASVYLFLLLTFIFHLNIDAQSVLKDVIPKKDSLNSISRSLLRNEKKEDSLQNIRFKDVKAWNLSKFGICIPISMDTLMYKYYQSAVNEGKDISVGSLGNPGLPLYSKIYFHSFPISNFTFFNSLYPYLPLPEKQLYLNTKLPYTRLTYIRSIASIQRRDEEFDGIFSMNFGKKLNIGGAFNYKYDRGYYASQSIKNTATKLFASRVGDRLSFYLFFSNFSYVNFENGGIKDITYITEPEKVDERTTTKDIPTFLNQTWNSVHSKFGNASITYNWGYDKAKIAGKDSLKIFVPVAGISLTSRINSSSRRFISYDTIPERIGNKNISPIDSYYHGKTFYKSPQNDSVNYLSVKNTLLLSLYEGFKPWVKFGLNAFVEQDIRRYSMPELNPDSAISYQMHKESETRIGGFLSKKRGKYFHYDAYADLVVLGRRIGSFNVKANANITYLKKKAPLVDLNVFADLKNQKPVYLQDHFHSKYFWWDKNFKFVRSLTIGATLTVPQTKSKINVTTRSIQNTLYFSSEKQLEQFPSNLQILSASLDQRLAFRGFHWDNVIYYQISSNSDVAPVPRISIYSNVYYQNKFFNTLKLQLGTDLFIHTKYFAKGYDPLLFNFYNQNKTKIGGYPVMTAYANMHLKQARVFVMLYNYAYKFMKPNYFSVPNYPLDPFSFRVGISWNLHN